MYSAILLTHSFFRWLVLAVLLLAIFRSFQGWLTKKPFTNFDNTIRKATATILQIQFVLGLILYCVSPVTDYFLKNFRIAVQERQIRFIGIEHSILMVMAVLIITIGSIKAKYRTTDQKKFKTMAIWFTIGLVILLTAIPWSFSPMVSRPMLEHLERNSNQTAVTFVMVTIIL